MKNLNIVGFILIFLIWYIIIAFITWKTDITSWGWLARTFWVCFSLLSFDRFKNK